MLTEFADTELTVSVCSASFKLNFISLLAPVTKDVPSESSASEIAEEPRITKNKIIPANTKTNAPAIIKINFLESLNLFPVSGCIGF